MARSELHWRKAKEFNPERWLVEFPEDDQKELRPFLLEPAHSLIVI
jgi:hypothetical protein